LKQAAAIGVLLVLTSACFSVQALDVGYAGFAYAGDYQSIQSRFPFTAQIVPPHAAQEGVEPSAAEKQLLDGARSVKASNFNVVVDSLTKLEGRDQAIMVALVATGETVSTERIGDVTKLFVNLRAQALFFDFKSMTVLRAYPISVVYIDALESDPTSAEKLERVHELVIGGKQPGLIGHFLARLGEAALPGSVTRYIGVTSVTVSPDAASDLPAYLGGTGIAETWLADQFSGTLLDKSGVSVLPFSKGYAIGNTMATHLADGTVFNLKLPSPDYSISLELQSLKKIKYGDVAAGTSFIYGAFVHLLVQEPMLQRRYFDAVLKNGETKVVPASQSTVDDWPAFEDSIVGLFRKFAATVAGTDDKWIRSSAAAADVMQQVDATRKVLNSCK
jgi:hypothetical protein